MLAHRPKNTTSISNFYLFILFISLVASLVGAQLSPFGSPLFGSPTSYGSPFNWPPFPSVRNPQPMYNPFTNYFPASSWFRPPPSPSTFSSFTSYPSYRVPRPMSPVQLCRNSGACKQMDHGTTLPTTWKVQATTLPSTVYFTTTPATRLIDGGRTTTRFSNLGRSDESDQISMLNSTSNRTTTTQSAMPLVMPKPPKPAPTDLATDASRALMN